MDTPEMDYKGRCATIPYLSAVSQEREWSGIASTTQLLNGTMYEFLRLTKPYSATPDSRAFALHGTHSHDQLEQAAKKLGLPSEIALNIDRDIFDLLQPAQDGWILVDNKTWGSYKVGKALGMQDPVKVPDPSGELYKRDSQYGKAGTPKMVNLFKQDPAKADMWEAELQLNRYRVMLDDLGVKVVSMALFVVVRDGGLQVATSRGVDRNIYLIPVKKLDDNFITGYFMAKDNALKLALATGKWSEPCDSRECWEGAKCASYCECWMYCPKGLLLKK